ncbi:replication initiator protein A [Staphylococcus epidermidis]|uniref:replication initiator protein A n=1 Tax=Staphylococcus epidermidis TaxID=1282 RepID=UPI0001AB1C7A|nr:replication initiator protein A [Staphylococcus epidermidis]EES57913.1 replication initiator protein A domain protein [Staphylococcus epidermidis BCM-HMP0060]MCG1795557.1 replication initiator protein A [Staphylococcus epidermidis]MCG2488048.1 replication initiator protein A [Staphylococcus epidermidis]MCG2539999.1 replication initiator protein A [Staphylococcus epidermidis]MCO6333696.1 replication initiator protein A [Staphylococcus epidermidis]
MTKQQRFTKLYKFLFEDPAFNDLPSKAKLLYSLLTERQNLSKLNAKQHGIQSQFIDDNGRLFSIYSNDELMQKMNMSKPTIIKLKKQLSESDLLEEVRLGKNQPNRLYPKKPYDKYFYAYDVDEFYRLPHALFENPKYKSLNTESIIAYAIYLSRYEYSIYKNSLKNMNNEIYCYFANDKLAKILNISQRKVTKIKNELVATHLLINEKGHFGQANKLYIKLPEVHYSKEVKNLHVGKLKTCTSGSKKFARREVKNLPTSYTYSSDTYISDINSSDTYDIECNYTQYSDKRLNHTSHTHKTNYEFNEQKVEQDILLQNLPETIQINLKYFNNLEIRCIKGVMNKAKTNYNTHVSFEERVTYEECAYDIGEALRRIKLLSRQKNESVCDLEAYMMQTFKNVFFDYIRSRQQRAYAMNKNEDNFSIANFEPQNDVQAMAKQMFMN